MADKTKNPFDKFVKKLDPKTRKKLQILFPDPSKKVIHIKKTPLTVTSPESITTKIKFGYGDKLTVDAARTDPSFKKLSAPAKQNYIEFMDKQIKSNQPMTAKQIANLKIIKAKLDKLNRLEKLAGDKGSRIRQIIKGFNNPKRGK